MANKHISSSPFPSLCLIFSSLLPVIPPPHLSFSPHFAGDTSATPLAKRLAAKSAGRHQLLRLLLLTPKGDAKFIYSFFSFFFSPNLWDTSKLLMETLLSKAFNFTANIELWPEVAFRNYLDSQAPTETLLMVTYCHLWGTAANII